MIRVFVVAADAVTRSALTDLLRSDSGIEVTGSGTALRMVHSSGLASRPDAIVVDSAGAAHNDLPFDFGDRPAMVLLVHDWTRPEIRLALRNGAKAILAHDSSPSEVIAAVHAAAAGLVVLGADTAEAMLPVSLSREERIATTEPLTPREIQVLALLAEGSGNKKIADRLGVSEHTVKFHVSSVLGKLGATSRTEAVAEGIRRGLVVV